MGRYRNLRLIPKPMRPCRLGLSTTGHARRQSGALMALLATAAMVCSIPGFLHAPHAAAATLTEHLNALGVILPRERAPAPDFALDGPDGHALSLKGLRGKVVFLNFWATWCVPCRQEMPAMERLYQSYRARGLAVVAVNYKESPAEVKAFMEELHLTFPAVLDRRGAVATSFAVRSLPVTYLVDRDGKVLWKALGNRGWDGPAGVRYFERLLASRPR